MLRNRGPIGADSRTVGIHDDFVVGKSKYSPTIVIGCAEPHGSGKGRSIAHRYRIGRDDRAAGRGIRDVGRNRRHHETGWRGAGAALPRAAGAARFRTEPAGAALGAGAARLWPTSGREAGFGRTASISPLVPRRSSGSGPPPGGSAWPKLAGMAAHSAKAATAPSMSDCRIGRLRW